MNPTIHMNGTSGKSLVESLETVEKRLRGAREALKRCAPNGRDYYVKEDGPKLLDKAIEVHAWRLSRVEELIREIDFEIEGILEQEGK